MTAGPAAPAVPPGSPLPSGGAGGADASTAGRSTGERAVRGGVWLLAGFGGAQVLRVGTSFLLYHMVPETAIGLMALAWSVLIGLNLFSDLGIATSVVQNARGAEPAFRHTAFSLQVLRSVAIALAAVAAAPLVELAYPDYAGIGSLIVVCALSSLVTGFESISLPLMQRALDFRRESLLNLAVQVLVSAAQIVWAWLQPSAWALVGGTLLGAVARTAASHLLWGGDRFGWERAAWRELFTFGKWIFVSTALMFLVSQADRLIFAGMIPPERMAVYGFGLQLALLVPEISGRLTGGLLFAAYCRVLHAGEELPAAFFRYRRPIVLVSACALALCCGNATAGVELVAPPSYHDAWWIMLMLALGVWFARVLQGTTGAALLAAGRPRIVSLTSVAKLAGMVVMIPVAYALWGFPGAVAAYAATDLLRYAVMLLGARAIGVRAARDDAVWTLRFAGSAAAGFAAQGLVQAAGGGPMARCATSSLLIIAIWLPWLLPAVRDLRRLRGRPPAPMPAAG